MPQSPVVIAHVLHRLYLAGAEVLAADLSRKLTCEAPGRYRFAFVCLDETGPLGRQLADEGFMVVGLQRRPGVDWSVARKIKQLIQDHGIDLLHAHQYTPFFYAAASRGWRSSPAVLFTEHGRHYPDYRRPKRVLVNKFLLKRYDRVNAVGHFVRRALIDHEGIAADRVEVIHNGIDPNGFITDPHEARHTRSTVRQELGINDQQVLILQVARFHPVKDHATSIRAFESICKQSPNVVLCLVGDGDERAACQQLAQDLKIHDRVIFLGVREDVARLMAASDIFTLSSLSEGISVTLLEAMASGLPIATTDVGGNSEIVVDGQTGLLSPRRDAQALGHNLAQLIGSVDLRRRMGSAGRQRLVDRFTQAQMHNRYIEIYEKMLR